MLLSGKVHPSLVAQMLLRRRLEVLLRTAGAGGAAASTTSAALTVAYFHRPRRNDGAVARLVDSVHAGGALLAVHSVSASFKGDPRFADLLGGVFSGHGRVARATMHRADGVPEIEGCELPPSVQLTDEVYRHRFVRPVDVWYRWDDGEPAAWTTMFGSGRVAYLAPGHRAAVWRSEALTRILGALCAWCIDGPGSGEARRQPYAAPGRQGEGP